MQTATEQKGREAAVFFETMARGGADMEENLWEVSNNSKRRLDEGQVQNKAELLRERNGLCTHIAQFHVYLLRRTLYSS